MSALEACEERRGARNFRSVPVYQGSVTVLPYHLTVPATLRRSNAMTTGLRTLGVLSFVLSLAATAAAQTPSMLLAPPVLRINPLTGNGTATLRLRNADAKPIDIVLTGVPVSEDLPQSARVTFAREAAAKGEVSLATTLQPGRIEPVVMIVEQVTQPGDYSIDLFNGTTKLGTVVTRRTPLGLTVDAPPEGQSVTLANGIPTERILTN